MGPKESGRGLVGRMLETEMNMSDEYRRWKELRSVDVDAARRLSREQAHARR